MATHLDLEEQEQIDQLKAFWASYGNLITVVLAVALLAYAGWNGWQWWQRDQAAKAGAMFDQLDKAVRAADAPMADRVFNDMKERYPRTAFTQQAALLAAKVHADKGQPDAATAVLSWARDNATEQEYRHVARLRLSGVLLDQQKYDEALKQLDGIDGKSFAALANDRRGDILQAQGKNDEARAAFAKAWAEMEPSVEYRRLVEAKLIALGGSPSSEQPKTTP